ncbi:MAG: hypothetical protein R8K53_05000 [Mariprofundaceae bacterium]
MLDILHHLRSQPPESLRDWMDFIQPFIIIHRSHSLSLDKIIGVGGNIIRHLIEIPDYDFRNLRLNIIGNIDCIHKRLDPRVGADCPAKKKPPPSCWV